MEAMVALAVMGLASYFLIGLLKNSVSLQKNVNATEELRAVNADMVLRLNDPTACVNSFGNGNPALGFTRPNIQDKDGNPIYAVGGTYGNRNAKLLSITVGGPGVEAKSNMERFVLVGGTTNTGSALVVVEWEKT